MKRATNAWWHRPGWIERGWIERGWVWCWFAILVLMRFPNLRHGSTLYAEEAVVYYAHATHSGTWSTLGYRFGYLSIIPNLAAVAEHLAPVSMVRWISPAFGLLGPSTVIALLTRSGVERWRKALAVAAVVFTTTMTREWYSPIHAQFWFAAAMVVVIGATGQTRGQRRFDVFIAGVAGLSGLVAALAIPGLGLEWWRRRRPSTTTSERTGDTSRDAGPDSGARHVFRVTVVLAVFSVFNMVVSTPRPRTVPLQSVLPLAMLKALWQPISASAGDLVSSRVMDGPSLFSNALALVIVAMVIVVVSITTTGAWRVAILSTGIIAIGGVWFSLPPAYDMRFWYFGGRYMLPVVVPAAVGLLIGGHYPRETWRQVLHDSSLGPEEQTRRMSILRTAPLAASAGAAIWVLAAIQMGVLTTPWVQDVPLDQTRSMRESISRLGPHETGTFETQGCRAAPNPTATSRGATVSATWADAPTPGTDTTASLADLHLEISPPDLNAKRPTNVYVIATRPERSWLMLNDGHAVEFDPHFFSKFDPNLPSGCYWGPDPVPSGVISGPSGIDIPAAAWELIGPGAVVTVGVGDSLNDALANGTYQQVAIVGE